MLSLEPDLNVILTNPANQDSLATVGMKTDIDGSPPCKHPKLDNHTPSKSNDVKGALRETRLSPTHLRECTVEASETGVDMWRRLTAMPDMYSVGVEE